MKRRDFIKGLSAACFGTALIKDSLELEPSNIQVAKPVKIRTTKPVEQHYLGRGMTADGLILDEFACIPRDVFDNVVAGFAAS